WVTLSETRVGDDALGHLGRCHDLVHLRLGDTKVTAAGLVHLPDTLEVLSLTGIKLGDAIGTSLGHFKALSTLTLDADVVTDVGDHLRWLHLGRVPANDDSVVAFHRLPACPICREVIDEEEAAFATRQFQPEDDLRRYVHVPMLWECYARWENRPRFA